MDARTTGYARRQDLPAASSSRHHTAMNGGPRWQQRHDHKDSFFIPASAEEHSRIRIEQRLGEGSDMMQYENEHTMTSQGSGTFDDMFAQDSMDPGVARGIPAGSYHSFRSVGIPSLGRTPSVISSSALNSPLPRPGQAAQPSQAPYRAAATHHNERAESVSSASTSSDSDANESQGRTLGQSTGNHRDFAATPVSTASPRRLPTSRPTLPNVWQSKLDISPSPRAPVTSRNTTPRSRKMGAAATTPSRHDQRRGLTANDGPVSSDVPDADGAVQRNTSRSTSATSGYAAGSQPSSARKVGDGGALSRKGSHPEEWEQEDHRTLLLPSGHRVGAGASRKAHLPDISGVTSALASPAKQFGVQHIPYSSDVGQSSSAERANELEDVLVYMNNVRGNLETQDKQIAKLKAGQGYWAAVVTDIGEQVQKLTTGDAQTGSRRSKVTVEDVDDEGESAARVQRGTALPADPPVSMQTGQGRAQTVGSTIDHQPTDGCYAEVERLRAELARQTNRLREMSAIGQAEKSRSRQQQSLDGAGEAARSGRTQEHQTQAVRSDRQAAPSELDRVHADIAAIKRELALLKRAINRHTADGHGGEHRSLYQGESTRPNQLEDEDMSELDIADVDPATPRPLSPFKQRSRAHSRSHQAPPTAPMPSSARFDDAADDRCNPLRHSIGCVRSGGSNSDGGGGSPFVRHRQRPLGDLNSGGRIDERRVRIDQHAQTSPVRPNAALAPSREPLHRQRSHDVVQPRSRTSTPPQPIGLQDAHPASLPPHHAEHNDVYEDEDETADLANRAEHTFMLFDQVPQWQRPSQQKQSAICSLPTHDESHCTVCAAQRKRAKRRAARKERVLAAEKNRAADGAEEEALLSLLESAAPQYESTKVGNDKNAQGQGAGLLPQQLNSAQAALLRRLLGEHTDEFVHLRITYAELADELKGLDPAMSRMRRSILSEHVLEAVEALEMKAERISRLREILRAAGVEKGDSEGQLGHQSSSGYAHGKRARSRNSPPAMGHHDV